MSPTSATKRPDASPAQRQRENPPRRAKAMRSGAMASILHLRDKGMSAKDIIEETGLSASVVRRGMDLAGDDEQRIRTRDCAAGSAALRDAIFAESARREERRSLARSFGHGAVLEHAGPHPVLRTIGPASCPRPPAFGRDPCPRCGTRGDLGCRHRAPCEARAEQ